jgi:hypothetical protein
MHPDIPTTVRRLSPVACATALIVSWGAMLAAHGADACGSAPAAEIVQSGMFEAGPEQGDGPGRAEPGRAGQRATQNAIVSQLTLSSNTSTLPAKIGTIFGFEYRLRGLETGKTTQAEIVVLRPAAADGTQRPPSRSIMTFTPRGAAFENAAAYRLADGDPLSGDWTIQLWVCGKMVASRQYRVDA